MTMCLVSRLLLLYMPLIQLIAVSIDGVSQLSAQETNKAYQARKPIPYPRPNALLGNPPPPRPAPAGSPKSDIERFRDTRLWTKTLSSTGASDHEDAGLRVDPDSQNVYTGIYAKHIVYQEGTLQLNPPVNASREQILYAATTRPPNGSCLEVGTAYITEPTSDPSSSKTSSVLYVYDFCASGGGNFVKGPRAVGSPSDGILIDQQFMDTYAQGEFQGSRFYEIEIFTTDFPISASSIWVAEILNDKTGKWETLYSDHGKADDQGGWSIFETYYQKGTCSESLPTLGTDQVSLLNASSHGWELITRSMPSLTISIDHGGAQNNDCFIADTTGPASYRLLPTPPLYYTWTVDSH